MMENYPLEVVEVEVEVKAEAEVEVEEVVSERGREREVDGREVKAE